MTTILVGANIPGLLSGLEAVGVGSQDIDLQRSGDAVLQVVNDETEGRRLRAVIVDDTVRAAPGDSDVYTTMWNIVMDIGTVGLSSALVLVMRADTPSYIQESLRAEVRKAGGIFLSISGTVRSPEDPAAQAVVRSILQYLHLERTDRRVMLTAGCSTGGGVGKSVTMNRRAVGAMPVEDGWLALAGPGTELVIAVKHGEQMRAQIIANHLGGYMYLKSGRTFWLWDGYTRLRQLDGWEEDVAVALAAGRPSAAIPLVLEGWRDEIRIGMQGDGTVTKPPATGELEDVSAFLWFALALRFAEMHIPSEPKHPYARPQHFPIPLPCAARFVLRTVRWKALRAYLIMEHELMQGDDASEVESFYRAGDAPEEIPVAIDPLRWSDSHPIMRQLGHAFDVLYLEQIPYLRTYPVATDLRDAFGRFSAQEMQGAAWAVPVWLLRFGLGMQDRMGDRVTNERMLVFLEDVRQPEKVLANIL